MKFILSFLIIMVGMSGVKEANTDKVYSKTGHSQFSEIIFENEDAYLVNSLSDKEIKNAYKDVKWKLFGKSEIYFNENEDAHYVSYVIFSRSNITREEYTFTYDTSTIVYNSVSVTVSGNISAKGLFKGKSKEIMVQTGTEGEKETESYTRETESGKLSVVVYPNKKVTLRVVGEAKISNGIQKNYVLGICVKKGTWEVITVISTCYELIEEDA